MDQPDDSRQLARLMLIGQVGLEMVAPIILGMLVDSWLATVPWFTAAGAVLGLVGGVYHLVRLRDRRDDSGT